MFDKTTKIRIAIGVMSGLIVTAVSYWFAKREEEEYKKAIRATNEMVNKVKDDMTASASECFEKTIE